MVICKTIKPIMQLNSSDLMGFKLHSDEQFFFAKVGLSQKNMLVCTKTCDKFSLANIYGNDELRNFHWCEPRLFDKFSAIGL